MDIAQLINLALGVAHILGVIAIAASSVLLARKQPASNGTSAMVIGSFLLCSSLVSSGISFYQLYDLYGFEQRSETLWAIYDAVGYATRVGLIVFAFGLTRYAGLVTLVRGRGSV